jgi:ABC-type transporter Mla MlaB component
LSGIGPEKKTRLERKGDMNKIYRSTKLVLTAAFFIVFIGSVDTTYAQGNFDQFVSVPNNLPALTVAPENPTETDNGITLDLSGVSSVDANAVALVSLAARQVELAKSPKGAKKVAQSIIEEKYPKWDKKRQIDCLNDLWTSESHWNYRAHNYRSGAHGIPQALPAIKMEIVSTDWRTNPVTQIRWGLSYIKARYDTPCNALLKKKRSNWY